MALQAVFDTGKIGEQDVTITVIDDVKYVSIIEMLCTIMESKYGRMVWKRLKESHPAETARHISHQVDGHTRPMANYENMLAMIRILPADKAARYLPTEETTATPQAIIHPKSLVIGRNILTGAQTAYSSIEKAAKVAMITRSAFDRSYLNKKRQIRGIHWRSTGDPYWRPPSRFVFDPTATVVTTLGYIKAVDIGTGDTTIYESSSEAAKILGISAESIRHVIDIDNAYSGFIWSTLDDVATGTFSMTDDDIPAGYVAPVAVTSLPTPPFAATTPIVTTLAATPVAATTASTYKTRGHSKGSIIARDIATGDETVFRSMEAAKNQYDMSGHTLADTLLDKPRQAFGKHWRSQDATHFWNPPAYFKYNPTSFVKKTGGYIMSTDGSGNKTMYESISEAHEVGKVSLSGIKKSIKEGTAHNGLMWTKVDDADVQFWAQVI
jgi:hypothetical protein